MKRSTYLTFNAENAIFKVPPTQLQGEWVVLQRSSGEFQSTRRKMILQLALGTERELNCKNGMTNAGAVHISRYSPGRIACAKWPKVSTTHTETPTCGLAIGYWHWQYFAFEKEKQHFGRITRKRLAFFRKPTQTPPTQCKLWSFAILGVS